MTANHELHDYDDYDDESHVDTKMTLCAFGEFVCERIVEGLSA